MVEWKDIPGYEGFYQASSDGRIRSCDRLAKCSRGDKFRLWRGRELSLKAKAGRGYYTVVLSTFGSKRTEYVHRLVAKAFVENPENKPEVNHKDSDKLNNTWQNLEWVTETEHALYGYHVEGKSTPRKLTESDVQEIRQLLSEGIRQKLIATQFGITQSCVSMINIGASWNGI